MSSERLARLGRRFCSRRALLELWCFLLILADAAPFWTSSTTPDDDLVRNTVRLSFLYYALAINLMLWLDPAGWRLATESGRLARQVWILAWAAYLVHLAFAFALYHHGSHAEAVEHVREASGVGEGIYVSHLFTLLWTADVAWWWLQPAGYAARSPWFDRLLHAFMLFLWFNGTVVYESGPIRWAGVLFFVELPALALYLQISSASKEHRCGPPLSP